MYKFQTSFISDYRKRYGLTIREFCKKCNISTQSYYKIIRNDFNVMSSTVFRICKTLKINLSEFVYKCWHETLQLEFLRVIIFVSKGAGLFVKKGS